MLIQNHKHHKVSTPTPAEQLQQMPIQDRVFLKLQQGILPPMLDKLKLDLYCE